MLLRTPVCEVQEPSSPFRMCMQTGVTTVSVTTPPHHHRLRKAWRWLVQAPHHNTGNSLLVSFQCTFVATLASCVTFVRLCSTWYQADNIHCYCGPSTLPTPTSNNNDHNNTTTTLPIDTKRPSNGPQHPDIISGLPLSMPLLGVRPCGIVATHRSLAYKCPFVPQGLTTTW